MHKYSKRDARRPGTGSGSGEEVWKSERKRRLLGFCLGRISADRLEICMQRVLRGNERNGRRPAREKNSKLLNARLWPACTTFKLFLFFNVQGAREIGNAGPANESASLPRHARENFSSILALSASHSSQKKITDLLKKNTLFIWREKNHLLHCKILCPLLLSWPYL